MRHKVKLPKLGLYSRFFILFSLTTLLLAATIALGSVTFSENEVKEVIQERHDKIHEVMTSFHDQEINLEKMRELVTQPKVELKVTRGEQVWSTWDEFPELSILLESAEKIGSLYFVKHQSKYYLLAEKDGTWAAATALFANLLVYPSWLVYWPWLLALTILCISYSILRKWLKPVTDSLKCTQKVSLGEFNYRIESHPNTELAELTQGLNRMAGRLQQLFDAKNELLLAISHELRTPMARMKISLAMLEDNPYAADINKDIKAMDELISQLLEGERLSHGHKTLHLTTYYLPSLVDEVIAEFDTQASIKIMSDIPEEAVTLDVGRIKFLLRNLIRNALEHNHSQQDVCVNVEFNQQNWSVQVKDQGAGIAESDIEKIFEPFYCVEDIKHRSTKGVGLGLYLCQKIAQAHDGSLTVESEINQGSCFTLLMPHS